MILASVKPKIGPGGAYQIYVAAGVTVGVLAWFFGALLTYPIS